MITLVPAFVVRWSGWFLLGLWFCPLRAELEPRAADQPAPALKYPAYAPVTDVPGLPRVLLLGDSISIGYTLPVRALLKGQANVHRPAENCGDSGLGLKKLDAWLGEGKWDVIHFNFGLHDVKYLDAKGGYVSPEKGRQVSTPERYEKNLRELVARLKKTGAKLIFATTTPVPAGARGRVEDDAAVFNLVAVRVMKETGVEVNDLHAFVKGRQEKIQQPRNVHYTPAGYEQLAEVVAARIRAALPAAK